MSKAVLLYRLVELVHGSVATWCELDGYEAGVQIHVNRVHPLYALHGNVNSMGARGAVHTEDGEVYLLIFSMGGESGENESGCCEGLLHGQSFQWELVCAENLR